jgi:hypothetical protein
VDRIFGELPHAKGGSALRFEETKNYLPLHCGWLLLVTILHRYTRRTDLGLPVDASRYAQLEAHTQTGTLSGLAGVEGVSGGLNWEEPLENKIRFANTLGVLIDR